MGGSKPMMETLEEEVEEEENLIAAVRLILRALESNKKITNEARKILVDLGTRLSCMEKSTETEDEEFSDIKGEINLIHNKIMSWECNESMRWERDPEEANEYLKAVDEARRLAESVESLNQSKYDMLLRNINDVIQTSMARIVEEFRHMLVHNRRNLEPELLSFRSSENDSVDESSIVSFGDDSADDLVQIDLVSRGPEVYIMDLVNPRVIPDLKIIANFMRDADYGRECSEAFICARKEALDDCLLNLKVRKLSMADVFKMEWISLNSKSKRWAKAIGIFVRVYLASEKFLCEQIFGQGEPLSSICFTESSKASIFELLNFAQIIAVDPHQPEKLLRILDMYEVLADLIPDIEALNSDEYGSYIRTECQDALTELGDCVRVMFIEFKNSVGSNVSNSTFPGGGVHHLTRQVMKYSRTLTSYNDSLNACLKDQEQVADDQDSSPSSPMASHFRPRTDHNDSLNVCLKNPDQDYNDSSSSPMELHFRSLMSILECNLEEKSKLYKEEPLGHLFMMNNMHYMAVKVKGSGLRTVLGDDWIRKCNWKFQHFARNYERATWNSILSLLKGEGLDNSSGSYSVLKTLIRERVRAFYVAFEDIYKSQTGWLIPNSQLRDDLRISTSLKLLNFVEDIAIGPQQPKKLLRILDMYEVLVDLIPDIDGLYPDETGHT